MGERCGEGGKTLAQVCRKISSLNGFLLKTRIFAEQTIPSPEITKIKGFNFAVHENKEVKGIRIYVIW
jgi:hypothetical protein